MKINNIKIKPGFVLIGISKLNKNNNVILVAFPINNGIGFANVNEGGWTSNYEASISELLYIRDIAQNKLITSGDILWKKQ